MDLDVQLRELADRIGSELDAAADYYAHTKGAWLLVQELAAAGHSIRFGSFAAGKFAGEAELVGLSRLYVTTYLVESAFQHHVALLEDFIFGLLELWLTAHPGGIPRKAEKSVDLATILESPDKEAIVRFAVARELDGLKYRRPVAWFAYLNDRVKLGGPPEGVVERLAEVKASRDILAHNRGVVNETYLDKAGPRARHSAGDRLEVDEPYLLESWAMIRSVVADLSAAALAKA